MKKIMWRVFADGVMRGFYKDRWLFTIKASAGANGELLSALLQGREGAFFESLRVAIPGPASVATAKQLAEIQLQEAARFFSPTE